MSGDGFRKVRAEVYGVRAFKIDATQFEAWVAVEGRVPSSFLVSPVVDELGGWPDLQGEAACLYQRDHAVPDFDCTCGLYAFNSLQALEHAIPEARLEAVAIVALEGRVIAHDRGYRAERMRVVAVWVRPVGLAGRLSRRLAGLDTAPALYRELDDMIRAYEIPSSAPSVALRHRIVDVATLVAVGFGRVAFLSALGALAFRTLVRPDAAERATWSVALAGLVAFAIGLAIGMRTPDGVPMPWQAGAIDEWRESHSSARLLYCTWAVRRFDQACMGLTIGAVVSGVVRWWTIWPVLVMVAIESLCVLCVIPRYARILVTRNPVSS
ncbi:hypothetical protein P0W64_18340 [Tsukamurella sp. 8F]|uniref:hypothetical protein n=1 Tax=unclassified Tsukamurella TaxID=2633480 RepID=UPI0023B8F290|nr:MULTISPECIES: hypothetical protein [unclassified Tsukamurella]MDF0531502.1 hypothetical protein [Tsukamurella sp. 8J]MDF0588746.1 hypothetical protein [Tsukamurella sp. 8F]